MIRLKQVFYLSFFLFMGCKQNTVSKNDPNQQEWIFLFNGKDLSGWDIKFANQNLNVNYKNTLRIQDSMLRIVYDEYETFDNAYAHIYYDQAFSYYKLKFDYRFHGDQVKGAESWNIRNSGIMLHSQSAESNSYGQFFPVSIEIQFLGGQGAEDRPTGNVCTPGTVVEMFGTVDYSHCIDSSAKTYHGDQWVHGEVLVLGGESISHYIENELVLKYENPQIGGGFISKSRGDQDWSSMGVDNKEYWEAKEGEVLKEGFIALQAESHPIDFKNIQLLNLCGCMDRKAKNYKAYYLKPDNSKCIYQIKK